MADRRGVRRRRPGDAVTNGASFWDWHTTRWGVVLELLFTDEERLERYRALPVVRAAFDAVPDRVHGLMGAAALPEPAPAEFFRLTSDPELLTAR